LASDFADIERELGDEKELITVYFEANPVHLKSPALYRNDARVVCRCRTVVL